ncbi:MAG: site-specific integrase [Bacteroidetes bacterium]|nr:MAG: site-specific integrase [Bacteroidota bacterium]
MQMTCKFFSMISLKLVLDKRTPKKDGSCPLKLRLVHRRQTYHLSLGYSLLPKDWDAAGQKVKTSCKTIGNTTRFNALIHQKKQAAMDIISQLDSEGQLQRLSFQELKARLLQKQGETMLLAFGREVVEQMKQAGQHGNARVYDTMLRSVREFAKGKDLPMKQINYSWLKRYEAWYLARGNSLNGLSVNLRTLRALCNRAIKERRLLKEYYPFQDYRIKKQTTGKRAISLDDIAKLKAFEPQTHRQKRAKDYFFISFYLMGASFVDIAHLKLGNIRQGRIEYKRRKTGRLHSILLTEPLRELLTPYLEGKVKRDFILNVMKSDTPEKQAVNVRDELRRYNRTLKQIGELCGIETPLTSYVARHSYATIAKFKGVPVAVISEALGHASPDVTQIYLDSFDTEVLDSYHQQVIE